MSSRRWHRRTPIADPRHRPVVLEVGAPEPGRPRRTVATVLGPAAVAGSLTLGSIAGALTGLSIAGLV